MKKNHIVLFVLLLGIMLSIMAGWAQKDGQPIRYKHSVHITDAGLECIDCHLNVENQARASIPNIEICGDCHDDLEAEIVEERKVAEYVTKSVQIPWQQIHNVPDYAYFSHRRHVKLAQIECITCHGYVAQMDQPFVKPYQDIKMKWCMDCHEQRAVSNDCYACHR